MRHALGLDSAAHSYRNYYAATPGTAPDDAWCNLCLSGWAELLHGPRPRDPHNYYRCTEAGRIALEAETGRVRAAMVVQCLALIARDGEVTENALRQYGFTAAEIAAHGEASVAEATRRHARLPATARVI